MSVSVFVFVRACEGVCVRGWVSVGVGVGVGMDGCPSQV